MNLKKRIVFSRHGLRYPLFNTTKLENDLDKKFINWTFKSSKMGFLTNKGLILEQMFGQELNKMLNNDKLDYVFCNSMHRTYLTAKAITFGYSPLKDVNIELKYPNLSKDDSSFNLKFKDGSFINTNYINSIDEKLLPLYTRMEEIIGIKKGSISNQKTHFYVDEENGYLHVRGALRIATDICDLFILKYYQNFDISDIFKSDNFIQDLKLLAKAKDVFLDSIFANKTYCKNSLESVWNIFEDALKSDNKNTLIVGHDSNISSLMLYLGIDYTTSEYAIEKYPIGSKLIFELYDDNSYKVFYTYYHYEDIRALRKTKPVVELLKEGIYDFSK